jgi:hypothetical protein
MKYVSTQVCPRSIRFESESLDTSYFEVDGAETIPGVARLIVDVGDDTPAAQIQIKVAADDGSRRSLDASLFLSPDQMLGLIAMLQAALPALQAIEFDSENA